MFYQTSMGLIYLIFNQLPFLWDTSVNRYILNKVVGNILNAKTCSFWHILLCHSVAYESMLLHSAAKSAQK